MADATETAGIVVDMTGVVKAIEALTEKEDTVMWLPEKAFSKYMSSRSLSSNVIKDFDNKIKNGWIIKDIQYQILESGKGFIAIMERTKLKK